MVIQINDSDKSCQVREYNTPMGARFVIFDWGINEIVGNRNYDNRDEAVQALLELENKK